MQCFLVVNNDKHVQKVYLERTIINPTQGDKATASSTFLTPRIQWVTPPRKSDSLFCEYCALSTGVI